MKPVKSNKKRQSKSLFPFILSSLLLFSFSLPAQSESFSAPEFSHPDIQGNIQSPSKYQGKPLVIYFWTTWCPWCRNDVSNMIDLYKDFHPKGLELISVSLDKDLSKLQAFVEKHRIPYAVLFDGKGWGSEVAQLYGVSGIPSIYVIDKRGNVFSRVSNAEELREKLLNVM